MTSSSKDDSGNQMAGNIQEEISTCGDEINLMDYFLILWQRKWSILLMTLLPTLIVGLTIFLLPRNYKMTYVYDGGGWGINEKNYGVLRSRFYSEENLEKIIGELQKNKLDKYAEEIRKASDDELEEFVEFKVSPPFLDLSTLKVTDSSQLDKLRDMKALLLNMTIRGRPRDSLEKMALIIRDNFEEVTPLYMVQEQLSAEIRACNTHLANIEKSKFGLELDLNNKIEILAALRKIDVTTSDKKNGGIVLQFDIGGQSQYLPLSYQIQAIESKIVELRGKLKADTAIYDYYKDLLDLNARVLAELNSKLGSDKDYTINMFKVFLIKLTSEYKKPELKDYLASYIKRIENRILTETPVSENPGVYPVAKGTVKKSGFAFIVSFVIAILISFVLVARRKRAS